MDYYFPSCKFTAAFPAVSQRVRDYVQSRGMEVLGCCRTDNQIPRPGDRALCVCTNCRLILSEVCRGKTGSILEYIDADPDFPLPDLTGRTFVIQHCAKADDALKRTVCRLVERTGAAFSVGAVEDYCGVNFMRPMARRNLDIAPKTFAELNERVVPLSPEEQWDKVEEMIRQYPAGEAVAYCNSCCAVLKQHGVKALHLMELLFP